MLRSSAPPPFPAVLDASVRSALAAPASRVFLQFDLARHSAVLPVVLRQLLPAAGLLRAELHGLNVYCQGGFFKPHRWARCLQCHTLQAPCF